jgi:hypothetical protein
MPSPRRLTATVLALTISIGLGACADSSDQSSDESSSSTSTTTTTAPPTSPGCPTSIVPSVKRYCYRNGAAHAEVSGAVTQTVDAPIGTKANALFPAPMDMILPFAGTDGTSMLVTGNTRTGTYASNLPWAVRIVTAPDQAWNAGEGECDITVITATRERIEGSFTCEGVPNPAGTATIDATGTFLATA